MTGKEVYAASNVISEVIGKGAYLNIALKNAPEKAVRMLVYGVMEKYYLLNYIADELCDKLKNNLRPYMLVGLYCVVNKVAPLPVIVKTVTEALSEGGKGAVKGFFTAVLSKADRAEYSLPAPGKKGYEEVRFNLPSWLVGMYKKEYPDSYEQIIDNSEKHRVHVVAYCDEKEVLNADPAAEKTPAGYFVRNGEEMGELFSAGKITYMSLGSAFVCEAAGEVKGKRLLDCCAAPGGKAVYLAKKGAYVTACDVYPHRLELIRSYAKRINADVAVIEQDGTEKREDFLNAFDAVLCDVPCSGLGVIDKKRDIVINRTYEDILALSELQKKILNNCSAYVKKGGVLVYSTCTVFSKENGDVTKDFLNEHNDFTKEEERQYLPDGKGMEGFYVCRMRRN